MREYGKIWLRYWTHPDIQPLDDSTKLLGAYLLTGPHSNAIGCMRLPSGYVLEDLGWTDGKGSETLSKAFRKLEKIGFCVREESTGWTLLPKYLKFNEPENPNVGKHLVSLFDEVPQRSSVFGALVAAILANRKHIPEPFLKGLETLSQPFRKPEPEPEPEPEPKNTSCSEPSGSSPEPVEASPPVIALPTNRTGEEYPVSAEQAEEFRELYPGVDVCQQLRAMRGWLLSHPAKRKTLRGMPSFVNGWLAREQNKGRPQGASGGPAPPLFSAYDAIPDLGEEVPC